MFACTYLYIYGGDGRFILLSVREERLVSWLVCEPSTPKERRRKERRRETTSKDVPGWTEEADEGKHTLRMASTCSVLDQMKSAMQA